MKPKNRAGKLKAVLAAALSLVVLTTVLVVVAQQTVAAPGYVELAGDLSFGATTITGAVGRTVVDNHPYVAAVSGTAGRVVSGSYAIGQYGDYRYVFDSPTGDERVGVFCFEGEKLGFSEVEFKTPQKVTRISYLADPFQDMNNLNGAYFQGSNDGVNYTTLFTFVDAYRNDYVVKTAADGLAAGTAYKFYRLAGHSGMPEGLCIRDLKLYTGEGQAATTAPVTTLTTAATGGGTPTTAVPTTAPTTTTTAAPTSTGSTMSGYTELTGSLTFAGTTINGSAGRTAVTGHPYVAAVMGTAGWTSSGSYAIGQNTDYRGAFDSPKGDGLPGPSYFDGAKTGYAGVEFKTPQYVDMIAYQARPGQNLNRLNGAYFQGSNDGTNYTLLFAINNASASSFTYRTASNGLANSRAYKYYRIVGHSGLPDVLNLMELKLYTTRPASSGTGYGMGMFLVAPPAGTNVYGLFNLVRSALHDAVYNNVLILTPENEWITGGAWAKQKVDLTKPFTIEAYAHMYHAQGFVTNTERNNFGGDGLADGITFTMHNDNAFAINTNDVRTPGGLLGVYSGNPSRGFVRNSLVIELDTRYNPPTDAVTGVADPAGSNNLAHIAVLTPRGGTMVAADHRNVDWFEKSSRWVPFNISWSPSGVGGVLSYQYNGKSYSYNVVNCATQFGGTSVWWGFTGATGDGTAVQAVALKTIPASTVTLSYNANGGAGAPPPQTVNINTNAVISSTIPTRGGYNFVGWALSSGATSAQYQPGGTIYMDSDKTLYAVWAVTTVTLSYDANGGTGAPPSQTVNINTNAVISSTIPTRGGHNFAGWALSAGASSAQYQPGGTIYMDSNKTLYAVWEIIPQAKVVTGDWYSSGNYIAIVQNNTYENIPGTVVEVGIQYSRSSNMAGAVRDQGNIGSPFYVWLTKLSNSIWYYQAYVVNSAGDTYYGAVKQTIYP